MSRKPNLTTYWLYDSRYNTKRKDRAIVYCVAESIKEAKQDRKDFPDAVVVKTISKHTGGNTYEVIKQETILL